MLAFSIVRQPSAEMRKYAIQLNKSIVLLRHISEEILVYILVLPADLGWTRPHISVNIDKLATIVEVYYCMKTLIISTISQVIHPLETANDNSFKA